jgi:hypothetical protein
MKKLLIILNILSIPVFGQKMHFDKACEIIKVIHNNNSMAVSDKVEEGNFILDLYMFKLGLPMEYELYKNSKQMYHDLENKIFKNNIYFEPTKSVHFSKNRLKKLRYRTLVSFVKFDGNILRVNVRSGVFKNPTVTPNLGFYQYQFEFDNYGNVKHINWIERKE